MKIKNVFLVTSYNNFLLKLFTINKATNLILLLILIIILLLHIIISIKLNSNLSIHWLLNSQFLKMLWQVHPHNPFLFMQKVNEKYIPGRQMLVRCTSNANVMCENIPKRYYLQHLPDKIWESPTSDLKRVGCYANWDAVSMCFMCHSH